MMIMMRVVVVLVMVLMMMGMTGSRDPSEPILVNG